MFVLRPSIFPLHIVFFQHGVSCLCFRTEKEKMEAARRLEEWKKEKKRKEEQEEEQKLSEEIQRRRQEKVPFVHILP